MSAAAPPRQWSLEAADVVAWMDRAQAGDLLVYAVGLSVASAATRAQVSALATAGLVDPVQRRRPDGLLDYELRRRRAAPAPVPARPGANKADAGRGADGDAGGNAGGAAQDRILAAIKRAANLQMRCPTNAELARLAGLESAQQAAWRIAKLIEAGAIRVQSVTTGPEAGWRVVTLCGSGRSTLVPASWAAARAGAAGGAPTAAEARRA